MNVSKYVFSQLISFLSRSQFNDFVRKYRGDYYVKHFTCWNQLLVMIFGQLSNRESLRDLIVALEAHQPKCYHMGMGSKPVTKTTLARVNQDRDYRIFEDFAFYMMAQARGKRVVDIFKLNGNVYAFDSTTIDLCLSVFEWALFRKRKGGVKVHTLYDIETRVPTFFHITPARVHDMKAMDAIPYEENSFYIFDRGYNDFKPERWKRRFPKDSGILSDAIGHMDGTLTGKKYPDRIRRVVYWDAESKRRFVFFTNALDIKPVTVSDLYKNRWQIELFFKWLKQHLKIKKFWGETENAVRIQIYSAITAYCMMAIVQKKLGGERSIYEMLQITSISLTDTTALKTLFGLSNFNNVKEQIDNSELLLF